MSRSPVTSRRHRPTFRCAECGWESAKWVGRCGACQAWGTVDETGAPSTARTSPGPVSNAAMPIADVAVEATLATPCGVGELDRVLGGGLVKGAAVLLAGEPGVGKSTLLLEVAAAWARAGRTTLYVTGEESAAQVRMRADRTDGVHPSLYLAAETDLAAVLTHVEQVRPSLLIVDSVQTIASDRVEGSAGGVTQVREVAATLTQVAKRTGIPTVLVGHVTKDGSIAGPRVLEHVVDVVLSFEGERSSRLRMVRAVKNRFGPVDEVGCFDLSDGGIVEVVDPTGLFTSRHHEPVAGTCVTVSLEGRRPLLAEVQALVLPIETPSPRRSASGVDSRRLDLLLAVLGRRAGLSLARYDVYASTVGGARLVDPAADLAIAVALASAALDTVLAHRVVVMGEIGLAGEVRRIPSIQQRVAEAARLGFTHAIVPSDHGPAVATAPAASGIVVLDVPDVSSALAVLGLVKRR
ncbi:MAG: DNA repair protein RadA [Actinomycetota bacterium]|nr:DNA repair protein RadA [Actinomycetota bacterium]